MYISHNISIAIHNSWWHIPLDGDSQHYIEQSHSNYQIGIAFHNSSEPMDWVLMKPYVFTIIHVCHNSDELLPAAFAFDIFILWLLLAETQEILSTTKCKHRKQDTIQIAQISMG